MNVLFGFIVFLLTVITLLFGLSHRIIGGRAARYELRLLTWNILASGWFQPYQQETYGLNYDTDELIKFNNMRLKNIIRTIKNVNPDIICLQEIDFDFLNQILKKTNYLSTPITLNHNKANEGCATLYNPYKIKLLSTIGFLIQNEPNIYTHIQIKKTKNKYSILNVHLPRGGKCAETLKGALEHINEQPSIICGDFNSSDKMTDEIHTKYNKYWSVPTGHEYGEYTQLLDSKGMIDSTTTGYTTVKEDVTDHEDHIYVNKDLEHKIYYGDYLENKLNEETADQGENGLLHFTQKNQERPNWDSISKHLTSDHRWLCIDVF